MNDSPGTLELLSTRVDELEKRVFALEHPQQAPGAIVPAQSQAARISSLEQRSDFQTANLLPTLGRAMLGIAGAYLLRALASATVVPKVVVAAFAITYAFAWLVWAARLSKSNILSSAVYATTSTLILAPMLWETTLHFQTFSPSATACLLGAFAILATGLGWRAEPQQILWISYPGTMITAVALSLSTHRLLPFLYLLLLTALANEIPRMLGLSRSMWWLVAFAADVGIWGMIFIYAGPPESRPEYPQLTSGSLIALPLLLFAIYATSVSVRSIAPEATISILEVIQAMIAFTLAVCAVHYLAPQAGTVVIGIACLVLSCAGYAVSFRYLRRSAVSRNFQVFGMWSSALLAAGIVWTIPHNAPMLIALAAVTACTLATRIDCAMLGVQGVLFTVVAAIISPLRQFVLGSLTGLPDSPGPQIPIIIVCIAAAYAMTSDRADNKRTRQVLAFIPAFVATSGIAGLLVSFLLSATSAIIDVGAQHLAFIRAVALSLTAIFLALAGSRWSRPSMMRLSYVALVFLAFKLLFEDLRHGHMAFIAASIFLFAVTLIGVPRLVRSRKRLPQPTSASNSTPKEQIGNQQPTHT